MEVGLRRIVSRKGAVLYQITVLRNWGHVAAGQEVRLRLRSRIERSDFFSLRVVNSILGDVHAHISVDPHMASQLDIVRSGIVLCIVGVDIRVADMNRDVIARRGQTILIGRLPRRSDLNRSVLRSLDLSLDQTGTRQKSGDQQNQRSHGARRTYRAGGSLQS